MRLLKHYGPPLLGGLILGALLTFPSLRPFVFLSPAFLLLFLARGAPNGRDAFFGGWLFFFIFALIGFSHLKFDRAAWEFVAGHLAPSAIPVAIFLGGLAWVFLSAWVSLPYGLFGVLFWRLKRHTFSDAVVAGAGWVLAEFLRAALFFGLGWVDLGYWLFGIFPALGILGRFGGVLGLSFLTVFLSGVFVFLLFDAPRRADRNRTVGVPLLIALSLLLGVSLWGVGASRFERKEWEHAPLPALSFHGYIPWDESEAREEVASGFWLPENYAAALKKIEGEYKGSAILIFPEEVLPEIDPETELYQWLEETRALKELRKRLGVDVLLIGQTVRRDGKRMNTFLIFDGGEEPKTYTKYGLFPFVEYLPRGFSVLEWVLPGLQFFERGDPPKPMDTPYGKLGIFSCIELLESRLVRNAVRQGAEILLSGGSEIAWEKPVWEQDLLVSRFQAMAYRRFLVRAMKEGYSAIINPLGEVISKSNGKDDAILRANVAFLSEKTPYTKTGDAGVLLLSLAFLFITSRKPLSPH